MKPASEAAEDAKIHLLQSVSSEIDEACRLGRCYCSFDARRNDKTIINYVLKELKDKGYSVQEDSTCYGYFVIRWEQ